MAANGTGGEVGLARGAAECQDINANEKQWRDGDIGRGDDSGATFDGGKVEYSPRHPGTKYNLGLHQDEEEVVEYKLVPPDGGWGWMVVLGTFIVVTLLPALGPCFGVLFSGYLLGAGSSSTTTAWIFNLQCFLWFMSGVFSRPLTREFGWRPVAAVSSLMGCVGLILSAFTPNPSFLFFSFSVLTGLGGGMVTCQCFTILPHYFDRLRGFTNAIMMCGICLGQIGWPPLSRYLQNNYGFRGATLIMGAVMLHSCAGASFLHPFEWHQKKVAVEEEPKEDEVEEDVAALPAKSKASGSPHLLRHLVHSPSKSSLIGSPAEAECNGSLAAKARLLGRLEGWKTSKTSASSSRQSSRCHSALSLSSMDMACLPALPFDEQLEQAEAEAEKGRGDSLPIRVVKSTLKDLAALKSLRACIVCFSAVMCINGFLNFIMMVPFAMLEAGFSRDTSAWCVSVSAGCNLVTRCVVSVLSDFPRFNKRLAYLFGYLLIASSMLAFTLFSTREWLLAAMAVYGVGVGACMGIYTIVMIDVMGVERLSSVFGAANFCVAIGFVFIGPLIGFIRDVTQSYAIGIRITSGMLMMALMSWVFMNVAERIDRRREAAAEAVKEAA